MKNIVQYIIESNIEDLKKSIIDSINSINDEKFLKKIAKSVSLANPEDYDKVKTNIEEYLKSHAGIQTDLAKTLIQKIKHYGCLQEISKLIDAIKEDNSKYNYFTDKTLVSDGNIINDIKNFAKDIIEVDDNFDELLNDIAAFKLGGKVAAGKFEHLTSIFMKNLNSKNSAINGKPVCDINSVNYGFEYKEEGARITGNKNTSKSLGADVITQTCKDLTISYIKELYGLKTKDTDTVSNRSKEYSSALRSNANLENDLDKALKDNEIISELEEFSKKEDLFKNLNSIVEYLEFCQKFKLSDETINELVVLSFISQVPNTVKPEDKKTIKFLCDNTKPIINGKFTISKKGTKGNEDSAHRILFLWLVTNLLNYYNAEKFDYLILFKSDLSGDYISIPFKEGITIEELWKLTYNKIWCSACPIYTGGANSQNAAPMIKII